MASIWVSKLCKLFYCCRFLFIRSTSFYIFSINNRNLAYPFDELFQSSKKQLKDIRDYRLPRRKRNFLQYASTPYTLYSYARAADDTFLSGFRFQTSERNHLSKALAQQARCQRNTLHSDETPQANCWGAGRITYYLWQGTQLSASKEALNSWPSNMYLPDH